MTTSYSTKSKQQNRNEDLAQLMPQNIDAEEAILGAILVSPTCMNKVVEHLHPESFYKPANRYVYEAMLQLYNGEDKIDIVSVSDVLNINQNIVWEEKWVFGNCFLSKYITLFDYGNKQIIFFSDRVIKVEITVYIKGISSINIILMMVFMLFNIYHIIKKHKIR